MLAICHVLLVRILVQSRPTATPCVVSLLALWQPSEALCYGRQRRWVSRYRHAENVVDKRTGMLTSVHTQV